MSIGFKFMISKLLTNISKVLCIGNVKNIDVFVYCWCRHGLHELLMLYDSYQC